MCGILGIIQGYREQSADKRVARAMAATMVHRGPDDEGFYYRGPVVLGMRRLSIIDVPGGHQPISNEDGSIWVVFNGEIYNFASLREDLEARGHTFRTNSDTEVIVHLYEEMGDKLLDHLNGMFAFALWDEPKQRMLLARDRMGEKPLYFTELPDRTFVFASELKAILIHPGVERRLNLRALRKYLSYEFVPSPHSMIEGVSKLPPAHKLVWERSGWRTERYWQLSYSGPKLKITAREAAEEVGVRLGDAVRRRLISDVPLGVLLSGGVDSSSVAALACEVGATRVKTFSIGFEEKSFDESSYARLVAKHLGTEHHEQSFSEREMLSMVPEIPRLLDEPLGDASLIPTYLLSRFARGSVTVALGGDGGDELFAGYPTYPAHRLAGYYRALPRALREHVIEPGVARLPVSTSNLSFDFRARRFVGGATMPAGMRHTFWMGSFDPRQQRLLLSPDIIDAVSDEETYDELADFDYLSNGESLVEGMMRLDATHYLSECVLVKVDRASMAASLEVRAPFLDHTFIEYLTCLPVDLKLRGMTTKYILKRAVESKLPPQITTRSKKGFGMPVAKWIKGELKELVNDTFDQGRLRQRGLFNPAFVQQLIADHDRGVADNRKLIWTLLMFELWPGGTA
ncbi:MAG: asparagine synthase (glutamine-hydrolyzing) [Acidobacteriota bacterium]